MTRPAPPRCICPRCYPRTFTAADDLSWRAALRRAPAAFLDALFAARLLGGIWRDHWHRR